MWWRQQQLRPWAWYVIGTCAIGVAAALILNTDRVAQVPGVVALLSIPVCCVLFGERTFYGHERSVRDAGPRGILFSASAFGLAVLAAVLSPATVFAVPMIFPLLFMSLPLPLALGAATVTGGVVPLVAALENSIPPEPTQLVMCVIGAVLGPLIGSRIMEQVRLAGRQSDLLAEVTASRAEVARLAHESGGLAERTRLAGEIHDTLAQGFTSIITLAEAIDSELDTDPAQARRHLELLRTTARENLAESRAMVAELTPAALADHSLGAALRRQSERLAAETGLTVAVHDGGELPTLSTATSVVVLRSVQEAFANIRKHAHASRVDVRLAAAPDTLRITVCDNGIGFTDREPRAAGGFGLPGMRARVEQVGGTVSVTTAPETGTTVTIEVPA